MFTMPLAPLVVNKSSGDWMWTAATVLGLRTPKLQFNPSLPKNFDKKMENNDGQSDADGLSMLERYVSKLLDASFADSSLFWHYAMRHVPSPSLMCAKPAKSLQKPPGTKIKYYNDVNLPAADLAQAMPFTSENNNIPMHGYGAFAIGANEGQGCFSGWP